MTELRAAGLACALALGIVVSVAGCALDWGGAEEPKMPVEVQVSPAPSGYDTGVARERAKRVVLSGEDLIPLSLPVRSEGPGGGSRWSPCPEPVYVEEVVGGQWYREWESGVNTPEWLLIYQATRTYWGGLAGPERGQVFRAADVVAAAREVTTCKTYPSREGTPHLKGELRLPALDGAEAQFVFCERIDRDGIRASARERWEEAWGVCTAVLARDEIVSKLRIRATSEARAKELIKTYAPVAAKALMRA